MPSDDETHEARVAALRALAERVLESPADADQFLTTQHALLDRRSPLALARTEAGARRVETILQRLEHGLPV